MHVVRGSIDDQSDAAHFANNTAQISAQVLFYVSADYRFTLLSAEDQVHEQIGCGMRHCLSPLRGLALNCSAPMASAMGFNLVAALRLVRSSEQTLQGNSIVERSCLPVCDQ